MFALAQLLCKVRPSRHRCKAHSLSLIVVLVLLAAGRAHAASLADYQFTPGWATFGLALPRGAATSGVIVGVLPTQTDIKTTWPDGSIRFAIVTTKILTAGTYSITAAGAAAGPVVAPAWPAASVAFDVGGVAYTAALPAFSGADTWLGAGPLVREARAIVEPQSAGGLHPLLQVVFDVRSYADGGHRVDVSVQNARDIATADRVSYNVNISVGGVPVFSRTGVVHIFGARWRKTFVTGGLVESYVTPDFTPFLQSKALPTYLSSVYNQAYVIDTPAYDILRFGDMSESMGTPGAHAELSTYPNWTAQYLVHRTRSQRDHMLKNGDLAGSWSGYINEPDGVSMLRLDRHPDYWLDHRSPSPNGPAMGDAYQFTGPHIRATHVPSLSYVPYLVTGDRYYLDTLKVWANTLLLQTYTGTAHGFGDVADVESNRQGAAGLMAPYSNEPRGFGWGLRELVDAALATPDSDPDKSYFSSRVQNNLNWLDSYAALPGGGSLNPPFWEFDPGALHKGYFSVSMWQVSYLTWAVDHAALDGFGPTTAFRNRAVTAMIKLLTSAPALPPEYGASVYYPRFGTYVNGIHTPFATMQEFFDANYRGPADHLDGPSTTNPRAPGAILGYYGSDYRMLLLMGVRDGLPGAEAALTWLMNYRSDLVGLLDDINKRSGYALAPFGSSGPLEDPPPPGPDTEAPTTPSNLTAAVAESAINLSWTSSTDNVGVTGYTIYRNGTPVGSSATTAYADTSVSPVTTYSYTVAASDAAANTSDQSTSADATTGMFAETAVTFVKTDNATQGSWEGKYGSEGYQLAADGASVPGYASVTFVNKADFTWLPSTADVRALQKASGAARVAAAWYGTSFDIKVSLTDGQVHQVGLYLLDWGATGRAETIQVLSTLNGAILDTQSVTSFGAAGRYLVWHVKGEVTFRVICKAGANAVVGGLFFDAAGGAPVGPSAPAITWANPADIVYGTALSGAQLNATASVPGTFVYAPPAGTVLSAGSQSLSVTFQPEDSVSYSSRTAAATITVAKAAPAIAWASPAGIVYGTALSDTQLNATAPVPGTFVYTPPAGTVLSAGSNQTLSATFQPADSVNYSSKTAAVPITVAKAAPAIAWANPADIVAGTALSGAQLNATALVPGTFVYTPPAGTLLSAGSNQTLSVTFQPADTVNYRSTTAAVAITVTTKAIPVLTWANPADIALGTALSATQLNATASVPGTFVYTPPAGTVLSAGFNQTLTVTFQPADAVRYTSASATVRVNVTAPEAVAFVTTDTVTQGSWKGKYGTQGYQLAGDGASVPGYATIAFANKADYTWVPTTTDARALQKASGTARLAAAWYGSSFDIKVGLTDGQVHQVALYLLDWASAARVETIQVLSAETGAILDTRSVAGFSAAGRYLIWNVKGGVTFRVICNAGTNAVVEGLFFDAAGSSDPGLSTPAITWANPADIVAGTALSGAQLNATASVPGTFVYTPPAGTLLSAGSNQTLSVTFQPADTVNYRSTTAAVAITVTTKAIPVLTWANPADIALGTALSATQLNATASVPGTFVYTPPAGTVLSAGFNQTLTVTFQPADAVRYTSASATVRVNVTAPEAVAFVTTDTVTQGSWKGKYGTQGYQLAGDGASVPGYATIAFANKADYTWVPTTTDARALQKASGTARLAAAWYGSSFDIKVGLTDGQVHQVALYLLDWASAARVETIQVLSAETGAILDTRSVAGFSAAGRYLIWNVKGGVTFRVISNAGANAVVEALFFDAPGASSPGS